MVACDQSYWNGFSTAFESIAYALVLLRLINAAIVISSVSAASTTSRRRSTIRTTILLQLSSGATCVFLAVAATLGHRFVNTNRYDAVLESFLFFNYLGILSFDAWILFRDRAV
jgi:hypothetical protein